LPRRYLCQAWSRKIIVKNDFDTWWWIHILKPAIFYGSASFVKQIIFQNETSNDRSEMRQWINLVIKEETRGSRGISHRAIFWKSISSWTPRRLSVEIS
jgi:hypothetical protein